MQGTRRLARIGIYGGTFDPVHIGHLLLAEQCREQCQLDEVWFVPAAHSPFKSPADQTDGEHRLAMLRAAIAPYPQFRALRWELDRPGPSWTVDTLEFLHAENPARELFLLVGADSLRSLHLWRSPARIAELATLVGVNRGDRPLPPADLLQQSLGHPAANLKLISMPGLDVSATDIRDRLRSGRSARVLTPDVVLDYAREHGLYRPAATLPAIDV